MTLIKKSQQLSHFVRREQMLPHFPTSIYLTLIGLVSVSNKGREETMSLPKITAKERNCVHDTRVKEWPQP